VREVKNFNYVNRLFYDAFFAVRPPLTYPTFYEETQMKKSGLMFLAILFSLTFLPGFCFSPAHAASQTPQNAATVNGKAISMADYQTQVNRLLQQLSMTGHKLDDKQMAGLKKRILDNLVTREVLKQQAEKEGIKVAPAKVEAEMAVIQKSTTPERFAASLKQMNMTEASFKDSLATQMTIRELIDRDLASKLTVTPQEVKAFYDGNPKLFNAPEMIRASHILVKVSKNATPKEKAAALAKIKAARKRILKGEDFATVAKQVSEDPGTKDKGGDLNFFPKGQMVPEFDKVAFALQPGQVSNIVKTSFGYHIIKVTDKKPAGMVPFDKIKDRIEQHLKSEKMQKALPAYIEALKAKDKIDIFVKS
jgi:peptidyl-prolyl cis-trans isomerase C